MQPVLSDHERRDIHALGAYFARHIAAHWQPLLGQHAAKLAAAYARGGDSAYGTYLGLLFRPAIKACKQVGLRFSPPLPGDFNISREWGNADESDQQRWMWSTVYAADGTGLGTLVTITHHDHTHFRIPRAPEIIALPELGPDAVRAALAHQSPDFRTAQEFTVEYAAYLQRLEGAERP
jgi:hypothetical protein